MKKQRKRGRKPKPKNEKQSARIVAYVTTADDKLLRRDCEGQGMTPGAFLMDLWREWRVKREN